MSVASPAVDVPQAVLSLVSSVRLPKGNHGDYGCLCGCGEVVSAVDVKQPPPPINTLPVAAQFHGGQGSSTFFQNNKLDPAGTVSGKMVATAPGYVPSMDVSTAPTINVAGKLAAPATTTSVPGMGVASTPAVNFPGMPVSFAPVDRVHEEASAPTPARLVPGTYVAPFLLHPAAVNNNNPPTGGLLPTPNLGPMFQQGPRNMMLQQPPSMVRPSAPMKRHGDTHHNQPKQSRWGQ